MKKEIKDLEFATLEQFLSHINYNDGDVAIIDSLQTMPVGEALRVGINVAMLCEKGQLQLDVNGRPDIVFADEILFCPARGIVDNIKVSRNFECKILCLTETILNDFLRSNAQLWHKAIYVDKINIIALDKSERQRYVGFYTLACQEMSDNRHPYRKEIMQSIVQAFLFFLCGHLQKSVKSDDTVETNSGEAFFLRFLDILKREPTKKRPVSYYAAKLCITPKYLSTVCKNASQKSASNWINDYVLDDVRFYLRNTDKTVKEIVAILGFPNLSHFGSYVRKHLGLSPNEYRKKAR